MKVWETDFIGKIERAEGTKSFRFTRPRDFSYLPGQYFFVEVEGLDGRRLVHHFSFSSTPTNPDFVEFTTRIRESEFKAAIDNLPIGTRVFISEIHGEFTLTDSIKKAVFIAGGIGITAALSNILWANATNAEIDIILIYANRNQESIAFKSELENLTGDRFKTVHILSQPENGWTGATGHIKSDFIVSQVPDLDERVFFVSGPPAMVETIKKILTDEIKIGDVKIKTENFLGY